MHKAEKLPTDTAKQKAPMQHSITARQGCTTAVLLIPLVTLEKAAAPNAMLQISPTD
jgi:hypothetical protein